MEIVLKIIICGGMAAQIIIAGISAYRYYILGIKN